MKREKNAFLLEHSTFDEDGGKIREIFLSQRCESFMEIFLLNLILLWARRMVALLYPVIRIVKCSENFSLKQSRLPPTHTLREFFNFLTKLFSVFSYFLTLL